MRLIDRPEQPLSLCPQGDAHIVVLRKRSERRILRVIYETLGFARKPAFYQRLETTPRRSNDFVIEQNKGTGWNPSPALAILRDAVVKS